MVAIRRHNPYQRNRSGSSKKGSIAQQVRLVFWGLMVCSILFAGYLLRRVSQSPTIAPRPNSGPKMHTVGIGEGHHGNELAALHDKFSGNSNLRRPKDDVPKTIPSPPQPQQKLVNEEISPTASPVKEVPLTIKEGKITTREAASPNDPSASLHSIVMNKQGSGPTNVGFVMDLKYERENPFFWNPLDLTAQGTLDHVAQVSKLSDATLMSCLQDGGSWSPTCLDTDTILYAYNSASFGRAICGVDVKPKEVVKLDSVTEHTCLTQPTRHIFPHDIFPTNATGMPPIKVLSRNDPTVSTMSVKCDVPCHYDAALIFAKGPTRSERYILGEDWKIIYDSFDNPKPMERGNWKRDIYHSMLSRQSSIPISHFDFGKYNFSNVPELDFKFLERAATYFADQNCQNSATRRHKWVNAMIAKFPVKAYGSCQHNAEGNVTTLEKRLRLMRKHRLVLAYESATEKDAFTSLTWEALQAGVVPVIVGPANALDALPPKSFIWYGQYNSWDKFSDAVVKIADDRDLYESYRAWRKDETAVAAFEKHMNFARTDEKCRMCRWAHAKKHSLHWDAEQQQILPSTISRDEFCVSSGESPLLMKPFKEVWPGEKGEGEMKCSNQAIDQEISIEADGAKVSRRILHHDGVTDILLTELESSDTVEALVLRLQFNISNHEGAAFPHAHTAVESNNHHLFSSIAIQDLASRATVIANWRTSIASPEQGTVEIILPTSLEKSRQLRVIIEDVDLVNYKLTEFFPFPFGKKMTQDFVNPIELFYPMTSR